MKFGITVNVGNYNSLRCESTDCETKAECYEEVLFIMSDWGNFDAVNWWRDKIKEKIKLTSGSPKGPKTIAVYEGLDMKQTFPKNDPTVIKHSPGFEDYIPPTVLSNFALQMTGKYQWYRFADQEGKIRKCDNQGCNLFLMYNNDKKSYEHWKYDVNTGKGGYVQDKCDHYFLEGEN